MAQIYDFDRVIDRRGTGAVKTDVIKERYKRDDLLALWVADMDFETPLFVTEAVERRAAHHVYGYTVTPAEMWPVVADWIRAHHDWAVKEEWLTFIPGIVKGIGMAINVFTQPGDKIIIQPPVYHPFRFTIAGNGREVVNNPLRELPGGGYEMDFDQLEDVADDRCRMLVLSNPHNPGGIVWDADTLRRLADFCQRRHILVVSDEIHADMALWDNSHVPFATVSEAAAANSITFGSPSKTFNIAGIVSSYAVVPNDELRRRFYGWLGANELNEPPLFSPIATVAAFTQGEAWRQQMLRYVEGNVDYVINFLNARLPQIKAWRPQASFLVWLDCRGLGMESDALANFFVEKAGLALNEGVIFGREGRGFMRLNVGTSRRVLEQAMQQLEAAVRALG